MTTTQYGPPPALSPTTVSETAYAGVLSDHACAVGDLWMERGFLLRLQSNEASSGAPTCMHSSYATSRARRTYTGSEHRSRACTTVNLANLRMLDRSRSESSVLDIRCLQQPLRKFCDMEPLAAAYLCKCAVELCAIQSSTRSILKGSGTGTALRILATTAPRRPLLACGMSQPPQIDHSTAVCTQNVQTGQYLTDVLF